jgi:hypothetical protein
MIKEEEQKLGEGGKNKKKSVFGLIYLILMRKATK